MHRILIIVNQEGKVRLAMINQDYIPFGILNDGEVGFVVKALDFQISVMGPHPQIPPGGWV